MSSNTRFVLTATLVTHEDARIAVTQVNTMVGNMSVNGQTDGIGKVTVVGEGQPFLNTSSIPYRLVLTAGRFIHFFIMSPGPVRTFDITATGGLQSTRPN